MSLFLANPESEDPSGARSEDTANPISGLLGPHQKCHGYMMQSISLMTIFSDSPVLLTKY